MKNLVLRKLNSQELVLKVPKKETFMGAKGYILVSWIGLVELVGLTSVIIEELIGLSSVKYYKLPCTTIFSEFQNFSKSGKLSFYLFY